MSLLQMSTSGAIMILAVVVIRAFTINRLPKKTFIVLWGIVLLRLLVPFSFPSPLSAYSLVNNYVSAPQEAVGLGNANVAPTPIIGSQTIDNIVQNQTGVSISPYTIIWVIGLIVCALFFAISYFKCRREFRESLPIKSDFLTQWIAERKLSRTIEIRQSSRISAPLTYGIFKPIILMPKSTKWEDTKQIEYILAHEFIHIKRFDAAAKLLLTAVLCIHWFNPLVWVMYILSNRDIELSCDETVVRSFGETTKSTYALTLISMEEKKNTLTPLCNSFSKNAIEERITAIMKMKKTSVIAIMSAIVLIVGVTTAFATSAKAENENVTQAYATDTVISQQEQAKLDKQHTTKQIKLYSVYKEYGLTYEPNSDSLYYNGKLVRWFSDKINADNQYVAFVKDNNGMDLRTVRDNSYKLTGIIEVSQAEYDKHTQSIKAAHSTNGAYEQGHPNADLAEQMNLLAQYSDFGMSFNSDGKMIYNGELVRYFWDGVELEAGAWSTCYQYLNAKGTVDVFTKRSVIDLGNGGKDPFGNLIGFEKASQEEFENRDLNDFSVSPQQATIAEDNSSDVGGMTFAEKFSKYKTYGIEYKEERQGSGYGNVYFNGELVKAFIDETKSGGVFSYASKKGGTITVQTVYDSKGNLTGIVKK